MDNETKALIDVATSMLQGFAPPADMSLNEKQAWKEGIYYAYELIMTAALKRQEENDAIYS